MLTDPIAWLESNGAQRDVIDGLRPFASDWKRRATAQPAPPTDDAAAQAALAVGLGVADRDATSSAAAAAAQTSIFATMANAGVGKAIREAHAACADAVREVIAWPEFAKALHLAP